MLGSSWRTTTGRLTTMGNMPIRKTCIMMIAVAAAFATACQAYATSALAARFLAQANAAGDHKERVRNIANGSRRESALLNCKGDSERMYGYFRPRDSRLTEDERKIFNAYYCRVCYCLRILGGQSARFFTTFDMAMYSLLLNLAQKQARPAFHKCERFATRITREYESDQVGKRLANLTILMFGEKIRDDEMDGDRFRAAGMNLLFHKTIANARLAEPRMAEIARKGTDRINQLQTEGADLNGILETYGQMVVNLFLCIEELEQRYQRLFRSIAMWTFYIDMLHDYNKDYKNNAFNGFKIKGFPTLRECFDIYYADFIGVNQRITREFREALYAISDDSSEWKILYKIIDTALSSTAVPMLSTRSERWEMSWEYIKRNAHCIPQRSNFK